MKPSLLTSRSAWLALTLASLAATTSWSQTPPKALPPPEPNEPDLALSPEEPAEPGFPPSPDRVPWQTEIRRVQIDATRAMRDLERQMGSMRFGYSGPDVQRLLVIPKADATDESIAESRDDLAVMATILHRAANPEKGRRSDLLFELKEMRLGGGQDLDALMIDGFGAVFLVSVDYPLVAPAAVGEKSTEPKTSRDNTWEKTRREVLGHPASEDDSEEEESDDRPGRAYDATRVGELEQRLKEALQHAGNLRGLSPEDWIVVQVSGRSPPARSMAWTPPPGAKPERVTIGTSFRSGRGSSALTLRVRKSAVDSLAAKGTQLEDFVRDVKVSRRLEKPAASRE